MATEKQIAAWNSRRGIKLSQEQKDRLSEVNLGRKFSKEHKKKLSEAKLGKKLSKKHKEKISIANKGKKRSIETRIKISKSHLGKKISKETRKKIGLAGKGRIASKETRKKISKRMMGNNFGFKKGQVSFNKGKHASKALRKKLSISHMGQVAWNVGRTDLPKHNEEHKQKISNKLKGRIFSKEHRKNLRIASIEYINKMCKGITPRIGRNEKYILDELEEEYGFKIIRQYQVEGYLLDGYIKELNLAVEVDEKPKNKERDFERQRIIEKKLKCKFLRIKDYG